MKIEIYSNKDSINNNSNAKNALFKANNILVYHDNDLIKLNTLDGDTFIIIGKILGVYNEYDLTRTKSKEELKNLLSKSSIEDIKNNLEGRYILLKITKKNELFVISDYFGRMDVYYSKVNNSFIISSDLSNFNLEINQNTYDYFSLSHSLYIYGCRPPKKSTLYKGIKRLGVNEYIKWQGDNFEVLKINANLQKCNEKFEENDLEKYYEIWLDAIEKRTSEKDNLVFLSSGWDSSSLLAGLVHLKGQKKVQALVGEFHFSERSGFGNKFEVDRVKAICDFFNVKFHITKIDHVSRGPGVI